MGIYLDNAATSYPKPNQVAKSIYEFMINNGTSSGRGSYKMAMKDYLDFTQIHYYSHAIEVMKTRIRSQMIEVHVAEKNAESARNKLQEVMIVRKSHEVLKEKAMEEYRNEWNIEEGKEIDQLVSYTFKK